MPTLKELEAAKLKACQEMYLCPGNNLVSVDFVAREAVRRPEAGQEMSYYECLYRGGGCCHSCLVFSAYRERIDDLDRQISEAMQALIKHPACVFCGHLVWGKCWFKGDFEQPPQYYEPFCSLDHELHPDECEDFYRGEPIEYDDWYAARCLEGKEGNDSSLVPPEGRFELD